MQRRDFLGAILAGAAWLRVDKLAAQSLSKPYFEKSSGRQAAY